MDVLDRTKKVLELVHIARPDQAMTGPGTLIRQSPSRGQEHGTYAGAKGSSSGSDSRVPPMQISDSAVLIAHMDSKDPRHEKANEYVFDIDLRKDPFVQSATLLDLMPVVSSVQAANTPNRDAVALGELR